MSSILRQITAHKREAIQHLYQQYSIEVLQQQTPRCRRDFYGELAASKAAGKAFFISEFKRKSPSEGWINEHIDLPAQIQAYVRAGAGAISVLTDTAFFGGTYADLRQAAQIISILDQQGVDTPLLLQKDFILDPIQIYLARLHGAHLILLIAAILEPEELQALKEVAESLGMGVLVEVHDAAELDKVQAIDFPVLGINNRDLNTFRTSLNRVNSLARHAGGRMLISESGVHNYRDFQLVRNADGFLIGTGLMRADAGSVKGFDDYFRTDGPFLFKACGIRTAELLVEQTADFVGINFSPQSKRRIDPALLENKPLPPNAVALFYRNSEDEIRETLARYPFRYVQLYAEDVSPEFVRTLRLKVMLACSVRESSDLDQLELFAPDIDLFILDGARPGSGTRIETAIPADFPYPFLLAGGLHADNLSQVLAYRNCVGVDIASGVESEGQVDVAKIAAVKEGLVNLESVRV